MPQSIDRFVEDRRTRWARLLWLLDRAHGRVQRLSGEEVAELGRLYRVTTGDLAIARRDFGNDVATERLNDLVAAAHALIYGEAPASGRGLRRFFASKLPATVRANLGWTALAFALVAVPAVVTYLIGIASPEVAADALPGPARQLLAQRQLWTEIPPEARGLAGPLIITNNVQVALVSFAGGMTGGLLTAVVLVQTGAMLGTLLAVVQGYGLAGGLLTFISGHGFLELSAIFLASGAGFRMSWAILHPGDLSRRDALRIAGPQIVRVLLLVIPVLFAAGLIEGFLSPSNASPYVKVGVGLATGALLWSYILFAGGGIRELRRSLRRSASSAPGSAGSSTP